jgi:3-dehydroquinate dehydratase type I
MILKKIYITIKEASLDEMLNSIFLAKSSFTNRLEIRLDSISEISTASYKEIKNIIQDIINAVLKDIPNRNLEDCLQEKSIILTCRKKEHGGFFKGDNQKYKEIIEIISELISERKDNFFVDIDYYDFDILQNCSKLYNCIISYHNFFNCGTEIFDIINNMRSSSAKLYKIASYVETNNDLGNFLFLPKLLGDDVNKTILIAMGDRAKILRLAMPILGTAITFCSLYNEVAAPGQISYALAKEIFEKIYH